MKTARFRLISLIMAGALLAALASCRKPSVSNTGVQSDAAAVTVGSLLPLSGPNQHYGVEVREGMQIALDEVNAGWAQSNVSPKRHLDIRFENSLSGPGNTLSAPEEMQKLIAAKIPVVMGEFFSSNTLALAPIANREKVVLITPCSTNYKLRFAGDWVFMILPNDLDQATKIANYALNTLKLKKAAAIYIDNDYGEDLVKQFVQDFSKGGGAVVVQQKFKEGEKEFGPLLTTIQNAEPDLIFLAGHTKEMADFLKQKDQKAIKLPVLGTDGMNDEKLVEYAGKSAEGIVFAAVGFNPESQEPIIRDFVQKYRARFGRAPSAWAAAGYDTVRVVAHAVEKAGTSPDEIRRFLASLKNFPGVTGPQTFDEYRSPVGKPTFIYTIRDGAFVQLTE
jgi:branched-chain amino acid transport system substrate-binding protein